MAKAGAADAHDAGPDSVASEKSQKQVQLMLMMLGRIWGLRQKPVQLMLMMLGRVWALRQNRCS